MADSLLMVRLSWFLKRKHFFCVPIPDHHLFLSVQKNISSSYRISDKNPNLPYRSFGHNPDHSNQYLGPCQHIQHPRITYRNLGKTYRAWELPSKTPPLNEGKESQERPILRTATNRNLYFFCIFDAKKSLVAQVIDL
jgi:hypothetical protein